MTAEEFARRYDALSKPALLRGAMDNWPVAGPWKGSDHFEVVSFGPCCQSAKDW